MGEKVEGSNGMKGVVLLVCGSSWSLHLIWYMHLLEFWSRIIMAGFEEDLVAVDHPGLVNSCCSAGPCGDAVGTLP